MGIADISNILGLIIGVPTVCTWLFKLISWIKKRHANARRYAAEGNRIAQQLLNHATTPTKRADIYLYMTLRAIEFSKDQTKSTVEVYSLGILTLISFIFSVKLNLPFSLETADPWLAISLLLTSATLISFILLLWSASILRNLGCGWQAGALQALEQKLEGHVP